MGYPFWKYLVRYGFVVYLIRHPVVSLMRSPCVCGFFDRQVGKVLKSFLCGLVGCIVEYWV